LKNEKNDRLLDMIPYLTKIDKNIQKGEVLFEESPFIAYDYMKRENKEINTPAGEY